MTMMDTPDKTLGNKAPGNKVQAGRAPVKVEEKLYQNRYMVDTGRPHIKIRAHTLPSAALLALTRACPAGCYSRNDAGQVEITPDGCMECGTCRVICADSGDIEWNYPRGGFGVLYKFG